ncbi:hypothetical protein HDC92_004955 [Pedobacter sp. AK017]|uniref:Crp/Fnr family transcriptional regulator n=1 Tax=Pedobacter sp. AK017 TaxID=2723073 RepID=UPI00160BB45F|nr:Crp/Fnr family transcriptional regulator [Pedobacter sp. AK017]MBB5441248.1 hypothetical protein [Pedobacter sp. AK017]
MINENWYPALLAYLRNFEQEMPAEFDSLLFSRLSEPVRYDKDTLVLKPGDIADMAYWPIAGYIRTYVEYKPEQDREHNKQQTIGISIPGKVSLPANSFMNQTASAYFMEISRGSIMVGFRHEAFIELGKQMPEVFVLASQIIAKEDEERNFERKMRAARKAVGYAMFLDHFNPVVESFVLLKDIATFIGMRDETLSRIRTAGGYGDAHLRK